MNFTDELRPVDPESDDPQVASDILNYVLARTLRLTEDLQRFAEQRFDHAPASGTHVCELNGEISGLVLEWVRRWPA
ncbi:hypothetical protein ACHIPZ_06515 [Antrihabitans sp. NCIMB 15449]|uniref:Uncharacterized protein n=1 Tax=Antrihabitans spumae TaxID=3373370 RepID=A0ABW7JIS1_9NOCA